MAIAESVTVMIVIFIVKAVVKSQLTEELGESGSLLGDTASTVLSCTVIPVFLFIAGIIGKILLSKLSSKI